MLCTISWLPDLLLACEEGLCSIELVVMLTSATFKFNQEFLPPLRWAILLCIIKLVLYIMHYQYTTYIKQYAKLQLGYIWLHVSAVSGYLQAD